MNSRGAGPSYVRSVVLALTISACSVALFSQRALDLAISIEQDATALMEQATNDFANHAADVDRLRQRVDSAVSLAASRPHNEESLREWQLMADPNGNLLGGFLSRWEQGTTLSRPFVDEKKIQVRRGFELIQQTEEAKRGTD